MAIFRGEQLANVRAGKGLTTRSLAISADCSQTVIERIERDEIRPSLPLLCSLAYALDVSVAAFYDDDADLRAHDDKRPTEMGAETDALIRTLSAAMPPMSDGCARVVSTSLYGV